MSAAIITIKFKALTFQENYPYINVTRRDKVNGTNLFADKVNKIYSLLKRNFCNHLLREKREGRER